MRGGRGRGGGDRKMERSRFRTRRGWISSFGFDFNEDFGFVAVLELVGDQGGEGVLEVLNFEVDVADLGCEGVDGFFEIWGYKNETKGMSLVCRDRYRRRKDVTEKRENKSGSIFCA